MDPNACYRLILEAWGDGDYELCAYRAAELARWLERVGFPPAGFHRQAALDVCRAFQRQATQRIRVPMGS